MSLFTAFSFFGTLSDISRRIVCAPQSLPISLPGAGGTVAQDAARVLGAFRALSGRGTVPLQVSDFAMASTVAAYAARAETDRRKAAAAVVDSTVEAREESLRMSLWAAWRAAGYVEVRVKPTLDVAVVENALACNGASTTETGWIQYSSRQSHRGVVGHAIRLSVLPHWRASVAARGLSVVDQMMTLCARPIECEEQHVELFAAVWLEQSRGATVKCVRGFIARRRDGVSAHGSTPSSAVRRIGVRGRRQDSPAVEADRLTRAMARASKFPDVQVTLAHSHGAGNCETGTLDWCARWMQGRESATVSEILATVNDRAYADRRSLVIAACLFAIRAAA